MRPLLYDILRLFIGPWSPTPRGIDRVDLAYAQHLFAHWPGEIAGVMPTPWGVRLYDRALVRSGLARLAQIWRETEYAGEDPVLSAVKARLRGETPPAPPFHPTPAAWTRQWRMVKTTGIPLGRPARQAPRGALYLNIGQLGWAAPLAMGWLGRRPDIGVVLMLHDAIPIEHPELVSWSGAAAHRQMMRVAARHIDGLITTTEAARAAVLGVLAASPRCLTLPLPLAPGFLAPDPPDPDLAASNYFVIYGAIEPRKNHALLLSVWRRLIAAHGDAAPRLVIAGSPAQGAAPVLRAIRPLGRRIIHVEGLSTAGLRRLIRSARAVLMPSLAEGFGLPVQEALSLGVPVIASDLPAHREIGAGAALLLPPHDVPAWCAAIAAPPPAPKYIPMRADRYFRAFDQWLVNFPGLPQNEYCGGCTSDKIS